MSPHANHGLRVLGHPLHAALSAFPLALLATSVALDGVALYSSETFWWRASFWAVAGGLVAAVPTAGAGLVDLAALTGGTGAEAPGARQRTVMKTGIIHMLLMLAGVGFFAADLAMRGGNAPPEGARLPVTLAIDALGAALLLTGGWYGGELVFRHGVGVDRPVVAATPDMAQQSPETSRSEDR